MFSASSASEMSLSPDYFGILGHVIISAYMDELPNDKGKIERLREALYSRKIKMKPSFVLDLHGHKTVTPDKWAEEKTEEKPNLSEPEQKSTLAKKIFWSALGFFVLCAGIATYVYISGSNLISANKIKIEVIGPPAIISGEVTNLDVTITNDNETALEIADLLVQYPSGTRKPDDMLTPLSHERVAFGDIAPHTTVRRTIKAGLFGEEAKPVHIDMTLDYRVPNTSSVFTKDVSYEGLVGSSPLTLSISALKEVNANQEYTITLKISSNSNEVVKNILLVGVLPIGFEVTSYSSNPTTGSVWSLGDITPHGERMLTIKGRMFGTRDEQRFFSFNVGVADEKNKNKIGATIASVTHTLDIKKPFLGVGITFGRNNDADYVALGGESVDSQISWVNNLDVPIYDVTITAKLSGNAPDPLTIKADKGFYDSNKDIISWTKIDEKTLAEAAPGHGGDVNLGFDIYDSFSSQGGLMTNPKGILDVTVRAKRLLESGVPQEIVSTAVKTLKVASDAHFSSEITHTTGSIENIGDIPPKVGQETTYTITWAVTNTFNVLSSAKVSATLPEYVEWKNVVVPAAENISYNSDSRTVTWNLGDVAAQQKGTALRKVAFQIGFKPSTSQIGEVPTLQNVANFSANDTFTNTAVVGADKGLTTALTTDPAYTFGAERVIK